MKNGNIPHTPNGFERNSTILQCMNPIVPKDREILSVFFPTI